MIARSASSTSLGAHLAQPVQQRARVLQHHPRLRALIDQLRDELAHPLIAPTEHRSVVVIADVRVLEHVPQVADQRSRAKLLSAGRDQRLVHVQRDPERTLDPHERIPSIGERDHRAILSVRDRRGDQRVLAGQVGQPVDALSKLLPSYG